MTKPLVRIVKDVVKFVGGPFFLVYLFWRAFFRRWQFLKLGNTASTPAESNPLRDYFQNHRKGPGIWKWDHYFDIYHRHFERFRGQEVHILEIGIYSGGSLGMWRDYFGPRCHVYGVDIEPACKVYERDGVKVFIGNQADRSFWRRFWQEVPRIDIIIDDGGHRTDQQIITLEETLPKLSPGGVFLCEDVHGTYKGFTAYIDGLMHQLTAGDLVHNLDNDSRRLTARANSFQESIGSIHSYPFVTVIEKRAKRLQEFVAPKHGTEWQPFMK